jgi:hypothetical protein
MRPHISCGIQPPENIVHLVCPWVIHVWAFGFHRCCMVPTGSIDAYCSLPKQKDCLAAVSPKSDQVF